MGDNPQIRVDDLNYRRLNALKGPGEDFNDAVGRALDAHDALKENKDVRACQRCGYVAEPGFENDEETCPQCGHHWDV